MSKREESMEERLGRLSQATASIGASPGFNLRVMQRIEAETGAWAAPGWLGVVASTSRRALFAAAFAAACGVVLAAVGASSADETMAASYTAVDVDMEIEW